MTLQKKIKSFYKNIIYTRARSRAPPGAFFRGAEEKMKNF